jgi:hypothetical protein
MIEHGNGPDAPFTVCQHIRTIRRKRSFVSHGKHRTPKPAKTLHLRTLAAGLGLAAATATGAALTGDLIASPQGDTTWGAPDTGATTDDGTTPATDPGATITPLDTTWG